MKTTVKQLATGTFLALLLIVVNVKAEGNEAKTLGSESIENSLQVEKWMIDGAFWNTNSAIFTAYVQETDKQLEIEDWMTNEKLWNSNFDLVQKPEMKHRNRIIKDKVHHANNVNNEPELRIEPWMLNGSYWK